MTTATAKSYNCFFGSSQIIVNVPAASAVIISFARDCGQQPLNMTAELLWKG